MHPRGFLPIIEVVGNDLLPISVGEEVNRPRRYDANQCGAETFEEGAGRLLLVYVTDKLHVLRTTTSVYRQEADVPKNVARLNKMP